MADRSPYVAAALSFVVPGAGQLYNGERAKGLTLLCLVAGIGFGFFMATLGPSAFRSFLTRVILGVVYLFVWVPAAVDAYQRAAEVPTTFLSGERRWYVVLMLLMVGPPAIPLLWQSPRFTRTAKILWTAAIILLAILGIVFLLFIGPAMERTLEELSDTLKRSP
jgi:hypothetical protein